MVYKSARGEVLPLTENNFFWLVGVDGQTGVASSIYASTIGGVDGDAVNNVQAIPRTLVFYLRIKSGVNVEEAKRHILRIIKPKQRGSVEWTQESRTVSISGYVEEISMPRWESGVVMTISIHCDQPFWEDVDYTVQHINEYIDLHYFTDSRTDMLYFEDSGISFGEYDTTRTKTFQNSGDVAIGMEIGIVALDTVTNPIIYDENGDFFGCGYGDGEKQIVMKAGDNIVITTHRGGKTVKLNGESIFTKIKPRSKWLQLAAGENTFTVNSDDESFSNMTFSLSYKQRYV